MIKWTMRSLLLVFMVVVFAACQNTGDNGTNEEGMSDGNNAEQTRYQNDGQNNTGDKDTPLVDRNRDRNDDTNMRNSGNANNNGNNNNMNNQRNNNRYEVADEAAEKISDKVDGIDSANVLTTQNNAYVAAELDNKNKKNNQNNDVSDDIKKEVSSVVRDVDNDIDNVYVSTNPDFVDLTNNYVDDMDEGKPVRGFFDQMGNMVDRLFPNNR